MNIVGESQVNVIWVVVGVVAESVVVGFVVVSVVVGFDAGSAAVGSKLDLLSEHPEIMIKETAHGSRTGMIYIQAL